MGNAARMRAGGRDALLAGGVFLTLSLSGCVSGEAGMTGIAEVGQPGAAAAGEVAEAAPEAAEATPVRAAERLPENGTISGSSAIDRMITEAAAENDIPRELAFAVVRVESRYNPRARGAGVYGLSQIMPSTARSMGFSGPTEALYDPETNLRYGMRYLKGAYERAGGDICRTSMKYKGGHRATTMTRSAQTYCSNVKRHMAAITGRPVPSATPAPVQVAAAPVPQPAELVEAASVAALAPRREPAAATPAAGAIAVSVAAVPHQRPVEAAKAEVPQPAEKAAEAAKPQETVVIAVAEEAAGPDPARFGN